MGSDNNDSRYAGTKTRLSSNNSRLTNYSSNNEDYNGHDRRGSSGYGHDRRGSNNSGYERNNTQDRKYNNGSSSVNPFSEQQQQYIPKPAPPPPRRNNNSAIALYDFNAEREGDLGFRKGDIILLLKQTGSTDDWWEGRCNGREGSFPANYVQLN